MVSNDDIVNVISSSSLKDIIYSEDNAASKAFIHTVPSGKKWVVRHIFMDRAYAGDMEIQYADPTTRSMKIKGIVSNTTLVYEPNMGFVIPENWEVHTIFHPATSGNMYSYILVDEENLV